ncbi:uncharacterized protein DS421_3g72080 [Arachis hypogaea]|nr:uncharacterized protein DS421_3g72080 [Arachis hypogaea]
MENNFIGTLNGLTSTLQAFVSQIGSMNNSNNQSSSSGGLPSQPLPNPKGGISAITLRSGTTLQERNQEEPNLPEHASGEEVVELEDIEEKTCIQDMTEEEDARSQEEAPKGTDTVENASPIPFSQLARKPGKQLEPDPKMVEIFKKVEVTVPLFDVIQQVPKYAKFLKDLCIHKDKINELETIPLGACVSIMPLFVYDVLRLLPLKRSAARFVLADKSIITVARVAEDVLVGIQGLTFPIDFYILEMPQHDSEKPSSILLGRPFLKTSKFKLDAFPGIYSFEIDGRVEEQLLSVLMRHKKAIGWSLADIVGIDPQVCKHRIFLEEGARPVRQPQRRLNPTILEVVKKEVTRLLEADIIYPISDSEWVSPVQVVPKKSGVTTIKNEHGELIATRVQNA